MDTLQHAMDIAKIALMQKPDSAFFTTVCFSLKHVWDNKIPTACTDGKKIRFNPDFFMGLSKEERVFLLVHESMHVAYLHMARLHDHKPTKWNKAADHVINLQLIDRGMKMPKDGLADRAYTGMSTEQVYQLLPESDSEPTDMDLEMGDGSAEDLTAEVQDILVRAQLQSKMANDAVGSIPGEIEIFLNKLLKPRLPWNRILQRYMQNMVKRDYTFRKPNRRFFPEHHLPSLYSENLIDIAIAVDASGSVSDEDFLVFVSEVTSIMKMMAPEKLTLIQFDYDLRSVDTVTSLNALSKIKFSGRGGTRVEPVLDWATENKPQLLLVFTDGHFRRCDPYKGNLVWLIHNNKDFKSNFGKTIHYEI